MPQFPETMPTRQSVKARPTDRYPKPDTPATPDMAAAWLDELSVLAKRAGIELPQVADSGHAMVERARSFRAERSRRINDSQQAAKTLARRLATGELDLDQAEQEAQRLAIWAPDSVLSRATSRIEDLAATEAFGQLGRELDGDAVLAEARDVVGKVVDAIRELRPTLEGITTSEQATANQKTARAWATYRGLLDGYEAAHELVKRLRALHWIAPLPTDLRAFAQVGRPDLRREDSRTARREGKELLSLLDPICDRWELSPAPLTEEEAARFAKLVEEESGPAEPAAGGIRTATRPPAVF